MKLLLTILWLPTVGAIIYSAGRYTINIVLLAVAIYLAKYLWHNNPFRDQVAAVIIILLVISTSS